MLTEDEIAHQRTLLQTYRGNLALYLRQQALMGGTAFVPPAVINGINESRGQIARIKQILRQNGLSVEDHDDDSDTPPSATARGSAPPAIAEPGPATATAPDRIRLRQILTERFNEEELRDLAFDLGIDYESLPGTGKAGKARELIAYAERRSRLEALVAQVSQLRPGAL